MSLILAIDIGTTGVRVAFVSEAGEIVADAAHPCAHEVPREGWAEADPDAWWSLACGLICELGSRVRLEQTRVVAVAGQAPTAVLVRADGKILRSAILWLDSRSRKQADELAPLFQDVLPHPYYLGPKLRWLVEEEPDVFRAARWVMQSHSYLTFRLTGEVAIDYSTAALCAPLFDSTTRTWSSEAAAKIGIPLDCLPTIRPAHAVLGEISAVAAAATGLPKGIPVVVGGGDFAAATLGAGVIEEGQACLMLGTAGNLLMPIRGRKFEKRLINSHHVGCDRYLALGGTLCGAVIEWFCKTIGSGVDFPLLEAEASRIPAGADGLVMLPYLQGERTPLWDVHARGVYFGLSPQHTRGHMYRALLEAIALNFRHCQALAQGQGLSLTGIVAANGAGRSALFRQLLADVMGVPLTYVPDGQGTITGTAALGALATGALQNVWDVLSWRRRTISHEPNRLTRGLYGSLFEWRTSLYETLKPQFERRHEWLREVKNQSKK